MIMTLSGNLDYNFEKWHPIQPHPYNHNKRHVTSIIMTKQGKDLNGDLKQE